MRSVLRWLLKPLMQEIRQMFIDDVNVLIQGVSAKIDQVPDRIAAKIAAAGQLPAGAEVLSSDQQAAVISGVRALGDKVDALAQ